MAAGTYKWISSFTCMQEELSQYGIDWRGPVLIDEDLDVVEVPETPAPIPSHQFDVLKSEIDPMCDSEDYGIDLYAAVKLFLNNMDT